MKIIDLLNKIANGEEVPEIIKYNNFIYKYNKDICDYDGDDLYLFDNTDKLNDEVEILEEEKKTIDDLNLSLQEIEAFQEARQIFLKLENEEDKQTFIKLLLGEGMYERWLDVEKIPQFKGTLEQSDNLCNIKSKGE